MDAQSGLHEKLVWIRESMAFVIPELALTIGLLTVLLSGLLFRKRQAFLIFSGLSIATLCGSLIYVITAWSDSKNPVRLFYGMLRFDDFSSYFKLLIDFAGILTILLSHFSPDISKSKFKSEYYTLLLSTILGAHLLVMSMNLIMVFISLEILSISAYILTGFGDDKKGAEGSLKYFAFGSVASAIMVYGFSILYGVTGTVDFSSREFSEAMFSTSPMLVFVAGLLSLAGFLYKIAAAPFHLWAPDVYEAAPLPVVAFFSVVPKLAGIGIFTKFILAINAFGQSSHDWQLVVCLLALFSITIGNFSALWQKDPKRLMAYSSIAQSGFLLAGLAAFSWNGIHYLLFYSTAFLLANFGVFSCLQGLQKNGYTSIPSFTGAGRYLSTGSVLLFIAFISLTGIPPSGGFTAKLFIFSGIWESYEQTGKTILIFLLVFGIINTVVSLFYYVKIPYYSFIKGGELKPTNLVPTPFENFLGGILVLAVIALFIKPGLLMGLLNSINFVL